MTDLRIQPMDSWGDAFTTWVQNNTPQPGDVIRDRFGPVLVVESAKELYTDESRGWVPRVFPYAGVHVVGSGMLHCETWWEDRDVFHRVANPLVEDYVRGLLHMVDNPGTTCPGVPGGFLPDQGELTRRRLEATFCLSYANKKPTFYCADRRGTPVIRTPEGRRRGINQGSIRGIVHLGASLKPDLSGGFEGFDTLRDLMHSVELAWTDMSDVQRDYVVQWCKRLGERDA